MNPPRQPARSLEVVDAGAMAPVQNMALDEALLLHGTPATLRLYSWSPPGLSIGYFQAAAGFQALSGRHVMVRRLTGGAAIYHDAEITFSLTLDTELLPGPVARSYEILHGAISRALARVGVPTVAAKSPPARNRARPDKDWCFAKPVKPDLVTPSGHKIVGSAQRRLRLPRPRLLHHGSIVLRRPDATPFCGQVASYVDPDAIGPALRQALLREFAAVLRLAPRSWKVSPHVLEHARRLARERYGDPAFLECR